MNRKLIIILLAGLTACASITGADEPVVDVSEVIKEPYKYNNKEFVIRGIFKINTVRLRLYLFADKPGDEFDSKADYIDVSPPPKWRGVSDTMDLNYVCIVGKFEDYNDGSGLWVGSGVTSKTGVFTAQSVRLCLPEAKENS